MMFKQFAQLGLVTATLIMAGCGGPPTAPAPSEATTTTTTHPATTDNAANHDDPGHTHGTGPNGGVVFDLGKYHAEFTVDHTKQECTVLFVTGDHTNDKPLPVAATELTLTTKETKTADGTLVPPITVTLTPVDVQEGKAAKFVGTDPGIGNVADFEGTVLGEIDGKPSQGTFKE